MVYMMSNYIYIHTYIYIYIYIYIYVYIIISSSYLHVVGDDRVCGTREQMLLQVILVRLSNRAWKTHGAQFYLSFYR